MTTATATKKETGRLEIDGVKPEVINMYAALRADSKLDVAKGATTAEIEVGKGAYGRLLPEGITQEIVETVRNHDTLFAAATGLLAGEVGVDAMEKHKALERVTVTIPTVGKDSFGATFDRSRQVPDRNAEGGATTRTKFGSLGVEMNFYGAKSRGQLLKVKEHLGARAAEALDKAGK